MAVAAMGKGVWERDTPPLPRGRLRRPGTPPGSLRGERDSREGATPGRAALTGEMWPRPQGQTQCRLWGASVCGGDDRERALGPLAVGEPPLKRRHVPISGNFDLRGRWFRVWGA